MGYGSALKTLFDFAKKENPEVFVTLDSDGQHDASDIPKITSPILNKKAEIVIGSRFLTTNAKNKIPKYRKIGINTITKFTNAASYDNISDSQCGFRAYSKSAISKLSPYENGMAASTEILITAKEQNMSILEIPINVNYDLDDSSTHNPFIHGLLVLTSIFRYVSVKHPLSFYSLPGFVMLLVSIFFIGWALELFSQTRFISTNMILISVGMAVIGTGMITTGIILYTMTVLIRGKIRDRSDF